MAFTFKTATVQIGMYCQDFNKQPQTVAPLVRPYKSGGTAKTAAEMRTDVLAALSAYLENGVGVSGLKAVELHTTTIETVDTSAQNSGGAVTPVFGNQREHLGSIKVYTNLTNPLSKTATPIVRTINFYAPIEAVLDASDKRFLDLTNARLLAFIKMYCSDGECAIGYKNGDETLPIYIADKTGLGVTAASFDATKHVVRAYVRHVNSRKQVIGDISKLRIG